MGLRVTMGVECVAAYDDRLSGTAGRPATGADRVGVSRIELSGRQAAILRRLRATGSVDVDALASAFDCSTQTIRRDLNILAASNMLRRVHGGAVLESTVAALDYQARRGLARSEKQRIGQRAAALIPNNCSVFLDNGTTSEEVANALVGHHGLLVITSNLHIAASLRPHPEIEIIVLGGRLRPHGGLIGELAIDAARHFRPDYAIIGAAGVAADGAVLDYDISEVRVVQEIICSARNVILVADHTKFDLAAPVQVAPLTALTCLVTDEPPPRHCRDLLGQHKVALEIADGL